MIAATVGDLTTKIDEMDWKSGCVFCFTITALSSSALLRSVQPMPPSLPGPSFRGGLIGRHAAAGPSSRRYLSASTSVSASAVGHYEALRLPRNATRQQIKARFYEVCAALCLLPYTSTARSGWL